MAVGLDKRIAIVKKEIWKSQKSEVSEGNLQEPESKQNAGLEDS